MPVRSLPARPDLSQLRRQAKELLSAQRARDEAAAARFAAHLPRFAGHPTRRVVDDHVTLAEAQRVIAAEYGFGSWSNLKHHAELSRTMATFRPHPRFDEALAAFDAGNAPRLRALLAEAPDLVHARTNLDPPWHYFSGATLLHHAAGNPGREPPLPANVVELARVLLESGAEVDAATPHPNGGTTMALLVTSHQASAIGVSASLMDLLLEYGARLDLERPGVLDAALTNHAPGAAQHMIALGAEADLFAAAALGRMDALASAFDADGRLRSRPRRRGRPIEERDAIGLALLFAYVNHRASAVDFLLEHDGNWDMTGVNNGTALHRAAWSGDLAMVRRLVAKGADIGNRDNPFVATPLSWAQHNRQQEVFDWLRGNCAIDLHDAVGFGLREHVEARLREDPGSVNAVRDQWDLPRSTALHWAAWPGTSDVAGTADKPAEARGSLLELLLDHGADPDIIAGNGMTALDIARSGGAADLIAILEARGARSASGTGMSKS